MWRHAAIPRTPTSYRSKIAFLEEEQHECSQVAGSWHRRALRCCERRSACAALFTHRRPLAAAPVTINIVDVAGNLALTQDAIEAYAEKHPD